VARIDQLEFLSDIVPRTLSYKKAVARKAQLLNAPDRPENNGTSQKKASRHSKKDPKSGQGPIDQFFRSKDNESVGDQASVEDESMDIDS
jgi:hypothetical protein